MATDEVDSAAQQAVHMAQTLGLRVCGMNLSDLLSAQIAGEQEMMRVVSAYNIMRQSHESVTPAALTLMLRLKEVPRMLALVLDAALVLFKDDAVASPSLAESMGLKATVSKDSAPWNGFTAMEFHSRMASIDVEAISEDKLRRLEPHLSELKWDEIRKAYGIASCLWNWICAVCVIAGSLVATLPYEDVSVLKARREMSGSRVLTTMRPRSCQGHPLTGRPSYASTQSATEACTPTKSDRTHVPMGEQGGFRGRAKCDASQQQPSPKVQPNPFTSPTAPPRSSRRHSVEIHGLSLTAKQLDGRKTQAKAAAQGQNTASSDADGKPAHHTLIVEAPSERRASIDAKHAPETALLRTSKLNELEPLKFLGAGAFANVFMCRHRASNTMLALKCILKSMAVKKHKVQQVLVEKEALSCDPHPCVIRLYGTFMDSQHLYFAMELAIGAYRAGGVHANRELPLRTH